MDLDLNPLVKNDSQFRFEGARLRSSLTDSIPLGLPAHSRHRGRPALQGRVRRPNQSGFSPEGRAGSRVWFIYEIACDSPLYVLEYNPIVKDAAVKLCLQQASDGIGRRFNNRLPCYVEGGI